MINSWKIWTFDFGAYPTFFVIDENYEQNKVISPSSNSIQLFLQKRLNLFTF